MLYSGEKSVWKLWRVLTDRHGVGGDVGAAVWPAARVEVGLIDHLGGWLVVDWSRLAIQRLFPSHPTPATPPRLALISHQF